jgi:hypothetical protein
MFFYSNYFYFITIAFQAICVIHCIKKGRQNSWIWIIVFLPVVGCIAYLFTEIFSGRDIQNMQSGVGGILNPRGSIRKLEKNVKFSDTFNNRIALADAYLAAGHTAKAIDLYESSLTGNFTENEHVLSQLVTAYYKTKRYADIIPVAQKIYKIPQFARSAAHICYAMALEKTGNTESAEKEFLKMKSKFANFESRYQYALLLIRAGRKDEAKQLLKEMTGEAAYLGPRERRSNSNWLSLAKEELKKL